MAKPITYSKRDNEKKKQEKRVKKIKKKEERKESGKDSFDDMIAYVDEYGVISSVPPEKRPARVSNTNNANTSTDQSNRSQEMTGIKGRVEYLNSEKGYGFIKDTSKTDKYFFHLSNTQEKIQTNDFVSFDLEHTKKGLNAINVKKESGES